MAKVWNLPPSISLKCPIQKDRLRSCITAVDVSHISIPVPLSVSAHIMQMALMRRICLMIQAADYLVVYYANQVQLEKYDAYLNVLSVVDRSCDLDGWIRIRADLQDKLTSSRNP